MVSTLKAIFQGRRELFEGLSPAAKNYDWRQYVVIYLDMGTTAAATPENCAHKLNCLLDCSAAGFGITLRQADSADRFLELVNSLSGCCGQIVILIDEYDKPLLGHLGRNSVRDMQALRKQFYAVVKATEARQRFVLITGVSKFSKVSVFSDLNNLADLTMDRRASTLLGYTQEKDETNFADYIERLAQAQRRSIPETLDDLRDWYNGFKFEEDAPTVYNPVSLMSCFLNKKFKNYWFETGTPTFLLELVKKNPVDLDNLEVDEHAFSTYAPVDLQPLPLLVQTGYLTIKKAELIGKRRFYTLRYPNMEISQSFSRFPSLMSKSR